MKFWLARLFGRKVSGVDFADGVCCQVTGYRWCGVFYVTDERIGDANG